MPKINKWLAVLCASTSAISAVSAYNLFLNPNVADQSKHEIAKKETPSKTYESENVNVDDIISDDGKYYPRDPGLGPGGNIAPPLIEENLDIYNKKLQKFQIKNIAGKDISNGRSISNNVKKKISMPNISDFSQKINNPISEPRLRDFVSHMNNSFTIYGIKPKKIKKNYVENITDRIEILNSAQKDALNPTTVENLQQELASVFPDFVSLMGGEKSQKDNIKNIANDGVISDLNEEKSNDQKIQELKKQFNELTKDLTQEATFDNINIDIIAHQKSQKNGIGNLNNDEKKSNDQKVQELKEQLSQFAKSSTQKDIVNNDSASSDREDFKRSNYSFDDDKSSTDNMFHVETNNISTQI